MYGFKQTGIGLYIKNLIDGLIDADKENTFVVFLSEEGSREFSEKSSRVKKVISPCMWYSFCEQIYFPFQIIKEGVDLMHFPHFNVPILYFGKFIVTIHDIIPLLYPGKKAGKSFFRRACFKFVFNKAIKRAKKIIAVSNSTKKDIIEKFEADVKKISVVYEGIPLIAEGLSVPGFNLPPKPFILYNGVWREHKNLSGLVKAFASLVNKYKYDINLAIVGPYDEFYSEPKKIWQKEGLDKRVFVYEFLSDECLAEIYKNTLLAAVPSFYEGFGFVGLEAMSFGVPVVASDVASLPEILGDAALYFRPEDETEIAGCIKKIIDDPGLRIKMTEKGKNQAGKYSWKNMIEKTLIIYKEVCGII